MPLVDQPERIGRSQSWSAVMSLSNLEYCGEPTADADTAAEHMRTWYEANRESEQQRAGAPWNNGLADNFMLKLMKEARQIEEGRASKAPFASAEDVSLRLHRAVAELRKCVTSIEGIECWDRVNTAAIQLSVLTRPTFPASAASACATDDLVDRLAAALKAKLRNAEAKYGWNDAWAKPDWMMDCLRGLIRQVATGDPLGVAAYAAFCWHHGWATAMPEQMEPEASVASIGTKQSEPIAWAYEYEVSDGWQRAVWWAEPIQSREPGAQRFRNIRPLYEAAPAPAPLPEPV